VGELNVDIISTVISALGVIVTGTFSYLIWQANKNSAEAAESAAKTALESAKISKIALDNQLNEVSLRKLKEEKETIIFRGDLTFKAMNIFQVLVPLHDNGVTSEQLKKIPTTLNFSKDDLVKHFTQEESVILTQAQHLLDGYIKNYFPKGIPSFTINQVLIDDTIKLYEKFRELLRLLMPKEIVETYINN
jgi:uncharacterized protein YpmB